MKIALLVEGETEKKALPAFLKRWLDPQLPRPVRLTPVNLQGCSGYLKDFASRARRFLEDHEFLGVVGLIDLYGSGLTYPDGSPDDKYRSAKRELEGRVDTTRFRQHFAVHETEAWRLSDPRLFPDRIARRLPRGAPEEVNFQHPPSVVLKREWPGYQKIVTGSRLFARLNPVDAYKACPHLRLLLDGMLALAANSRE